MAISTGSTELTYEQRLDALRATKLQHTREKQQLGPIDLDDKGLILPPPEEREVVHTINSAGVPVTDVLFKSFKPRSNRPDGAFFGPRMHGANFRALLEFHPTYVDPISSLAGAHMVNYMSYRMPLPYRNPFWNPEFDYSHLFADQDRYKLIPGIGGVQHFCQDLRIGLELGWGGILNKIRHYRRANAPRAGDFYDGLEDVTLGIQNWIRRHADTARQMASTEENPQLQENLQAIADINERLVTDPPKTFREACQWILWYQLAATMYNLSGSLGRFDVLLWPYYERDIEAGILTDEEAIFHIACYLLRDTSYIQLGGPDTSGKDVTNRLSYLVLEAIHRLKTPANVGVCVGEAVDANLFRKGVEILLQDRLGMPKFLGIDNTTQGFARNGFPLDLARQRAYSGCHWSAIPGREYTLNDVTRVHLAAVFEVALQEMMAQVEVNPGIDILPKGEAHFAVTLWAKFVAHLRRAVEVIAQGLDFHIEHMHEVFPELVLDLCCYGPIEKGLDASHGGVEFYNFCVDGAGLATAADSFAAIEQRVEKERRLTWQQLRHFLATDWAGTEGERARLVMRSVPRYGSGGSRADTYATRIAQTFAQIVKEKPTPAGFNMIPGLFSWAEHIGMGKGIGATPNGRHAKAPISHGANPDPDFRKDTAPTALAVAVASVQPGFGNTAPMQLDLDPALTGNATDIETIASLVKTHFDLGGTMVNINVIDAAQLLEAHKDPSKYPDLIVRVTGFSAYFASLSPELRQAVIDRIIVQR